MGMIDFRYRKSELPDALPDHSWRKWASKRLPKKVEDRFSLAGIPYREPVVRRFLEEAHRIETTGQGRYGLVLRREPENPEDPAAIAVDGWAYDPSKMYHLGYLYREDAAAIAADLPRDMPLAAELRSAFEPEPGKIWVGFRVHIPVKREPRHSGKRTKEEARRP